MTNFTQRPHILEFFMEKWQICLKNNIIFSNFHPNLWKNAFKKKKKIEFYFFYLFIYLFIFLNFVTEIPFFCA